VLHACGWQPHNHITWTRDALCPAYNRCAGAAFAPWVAVRAAYQVGLAVSRPVINNAKKPKERVPGKGGACPRTADVPPAAVSHPSHCVLKRAVAAGAACAATPAIAVRSGTKASRRAYVAAAIKTASFREKVSLGEALHQLLEPLGNIACGVRRACPHIRLSPKRDNRNARGYHGQYHEPGNYFLFPCFHVNTPAAPAWHYIAFMLAGV